MGWRLGNVTRYGHASISLFYGSHTMVQLILAFIALALVYFVLLYGGLRLMAAFNLVSKDWFENARTEYFVLIEPQAISSGPEFKLASAPTKPPIRAQAGPPVVSKIGFIPAFYGRQRRWQIIKFSGYASQHDIRISINFITRLNLR